MSCGDRSIERRRADFGHAVRAYKGERRAKRLPVHRPAFERTTYQHACMGDCCLTWVRLKDNEGKRLASYVITGFEPTKLFIRNVKGEGGSTRIPERFCKLYLTPPRP